jgi:hypothetical protein
MYHPRRHWQAHWEQSRVGCLQHLDTSARSNPRIKLATHQLWEGYWEVLSYCNPTEPRMAIHSKTINLLCVLHVYADLWWCLMSLLRDSKHSVWKKLFIWGKNSVVNRRICLVSGGVDSQPKGYLWTSLSKIPLPFLPALSLPVYWFTLSRFGTKDSPNE